MPLLYLPTASDIASPRFWCEYNITYSVPDFREHLSAMNHTKSINNEKYASQRFLNRFKGRYIADEDWVVGYGEIFDVICFPIDVGFLD